MNRDITRRKVIIDAGTIALSKDRGPVGLDPECGYGKVLDLTGKDLNLTVSQMSREPGAVIVKDENTFDQLKVGTRVRVLANHSCLTAAQHSHYNVLEEENIGDRWNIHTGW